MDMRDQGSSIESFLESNGERILKVARRYANSGADADDAYQRAIEKLLTKAPVGADDQRLLAWVLTVVKNEALMQCRADEQFEPGDFDGHDWRSPGAGGSPEESILNSERLRHGLEALDQLSPDELRCMLLKADGLSYDDIATTTGFSPFKVNRLLTAGRKRFNQRIDRIAEGAECRRIVGALSMIADGEAPQGVVDSCSPHLQNCLFCQSTLREFRSSTRRISVLFPLGSAISGSSAETVSDSSSLIRSAADSASSAFTSLVDRVTAHPFAVHWASDVAVAKKVAAIAAISTSIVAGGAGVSEIARDDRMPSQASAEQRRVTADAPDVLDGGNDSEPPISAESSETNEEGPRPARESDVVENAGVATGSAEDAIQATVGNSSESVDELPPVDPIEPEQANPPSSNDAADSLVP